MSEELNVKAVYDHRFGTVQLNVDGIIRLKVRQLIDALNLPPDDLAALLEDRYQWTEHNDNIEPARVRMLCETDWTDKVVLDAAGYDGFAAELAHKGGAQRAICLDNEQYLSYGWETKRKPGVEYITGDLFEWQEPVDKVILFNVLYHCKSPWRMLEHVRGITKEEMLLCSLFRYHRGAWVYLYEAGECNETDPSVFWGPSLEALERLLKFTGWEFKREGLALDRVVYRCFPTLEPQFRNSKY